MIIMNFKQKQKWEKYPVSDIYCENCKHYNRKVRMVFEFPRVKDPKYLASRWIVCPICGFRGSIEK